MNYQVYLALRYAALDDVRKAGGADMLREALQDQDLLEEARMAYGEVLAVVDKRAALFKKSHLSPD